MRGRSYVCSNPVHVNHYGVAREVGTLVALNATSGELLWSFEEPERHPFSLKTHCPVVMGDRLLVSVNPPDPRFVKIVQIDARTGATPVSAAHRAPHARLWLSSVLQVAARGHLRTRCACRASSSSPPRVRKRATFAILPSQLDSLPPWRCAPPARRPMWRPRASPRRCGVLVLPMLWCPCALLGGLPVQ